LKSKLNLLQHKNQQVPPSSKPNLLQHKNQQALAKSRLNLLQHKNQQALPGSRKKSLLLSTRLCKQCPWRKLHLPVKSISPLPGNSLLKPCLIPLLPDAETQTQLWDEHAEIQKWKKEYAETQAQHLQVHRQTWINHTFSNWEALDLTRQEVRELKKKNKDLKGRDGPDL
jgi:hypothetical protein